MSNHRPGSGDDASATRRRRTFLKTVKIDAAEAQVTFFGATPPQPDLFWNKELAKLAAEWPGSRLAEIWKSFAGVAPFTELNPVKKFTDRKSAVARIWAAVQRLSPDGAPQASDLAPAKDEWKKSPTKPLKPPCEVVGTMVKDTFAEFLKNQDRRTRWGANLERSARTHRRSGPRSSVILQFFGKTPLLEKFLA